MTNAGKEDRIGQVWEYYGYGRSDLYVVLNQIDNLNLSILRLEDGLEMTAASHALKPTSIVWWKIA